MHDQEVTMNLSELKHKKINDLTSLARDLSVEGAAGMRKQDLIFAILQAQVEKNGVISGGACWKSSRTASGSSGPRITIISPGPTTSMSRPPRSAASICAPGTPSPGRFAPPRRGSV